MRATRWSLRPIRWPPRPGLQVLKRGGSAIDAAVAIQAVLGLVEPQSSGLGGGSFMVYYDAKTHKVTAYDGREIAPAGATNRLFVDDDGQAIAIFRRCSGRYIHRRSRRDRHARSGPPRSRKAGLGRACSREAENLATNGFIVSPRMAKMIASRAPQAKSADALRYFTKPDGTRYGAGDTLKNPAYAQTLQRIGKFGASGLLTRTNRAGHRRPPPRRPTPQHHDAGRSGRISPNGQARAVQSFPRLCGVHAAGSVRRPRPANRAGHSEPHRHRRARCQ